MFPLAVGSIRARIFAIALLAFAPPAIFATVLAIEEVRDAQAEAESHLNAATRALADRYKRVFGSISETLTILADRPRIQRAAMVRGLECREILQGYAEIINRGALVKYTNIALNDVSTGLPLCSALTGPSTEGVGRAPWLQRIVETGEIGFGGYRIGVVTGRPILIAGTLVRDNDGRPAGVLLLAADLAGASAADHLLPTVPGLAATVFSGAGMVLFQYPETDLIGRSLHDASLVEFSGGIGEAGVYEGPGFDGVDRIFAVRRLDAPEPTFVAVGQLLDEVKRASRYVMYRLSVVLALTFLAALGAAWLVTERAILKPLAALAAGTGKVADGDYSARVAVPGLSEMERVAGSFNDMAAALDARNVEIKERRQQLMTTLARQKTIFEAVAAGIIVRDRDGRIVDANPAAAAILGLPPESLPGIGFDRPLPWRPVDTSGEPLPFSRYAAFKSLETGAGERDVTFGVHWPDGTRRWISGNTNVARNADGTTDVVVTSFVDVTERRQAEAELRQAQKLEAVGQLTGGIAHDFNNLLMVVISNLEMLEEDLMGQEPQRALAATALKVSLRGSELVQKLLAFSRRQSLAPKLTDVNALVVELVPLLRRTLGSGVSITTRLSGDRQDAFVDAAELENALINLAVNARDAMPEGGPIVIETAIVQQSLATGGTTASFVEVSVRDAGTGVPPEILARVFEPFFTTKDVGKGSGLGLSMVYGFAKRSGGSADIESMPGKGTVVRIRLPLAEPSSDDARAD